MLIVSLPHELVDRLGGFHVIQRRTCRFSRVCHQIHGGIEICFDKRVHLLELQLPESTTDFEVISFGKIYTRPIGEHIMFIPRSSLQNFVGEEFEVLPLIAAADILDDARLTQADYKIRIKRGVNPVARTAVLEIEKSLEWHRCIHKLPEFCRVNRAGSCLMGSGNFCVSMPSLVSTLALTTVQIAYFYPGFIKGLFFDNGIGEGGSSVSA